MSTSSGLTVILRYGDMKKHGGKYSSSQTMASRLKTRRWEKNLEFSLSLVSRSTVEQV